MKYMHTMKWLFYTSLSIITLIVTNALHYHTFQPSSWMCWFWFILYHQFNIYHNSTWALYNKNLSHHHQNHPAITGKDIDMKTPEPPKKSLNFSISPVISSHKLIEGGGDVEWIHPLTLLWKLKYIQWSPCIISEVIHGKSKPTTWFWDPNKSINLSFNKKDTAKEYYCLLPVEDQWIQWYKWGKRTTGPTQQRNDNVEFI